MDTNGVELGMDENNEMSPDSSPDESGNKSGIRRVNNMPLYMMGGVIFAFVSIMMLVAADKSDMQGAAMLSASEEVIMVSNAQQFAKELTDKYEAGYVEAAIDPTDTTVDQQAKEGKYLAINIDEASTPQVRAQASQVRAQASQVSAQAPQVSAQKGAPIPSVGPMYMQQQAANQNGDLKKKSESDIFTEEQLNRIRIKQFEMLEKAIRSDTTVAVNSTRRPQSTSDALSDVRNKIMNLPTSDQAYKEKLAQIKSALSGAPPTGAGLPSAGTGNLASMTAKYPSQTGGGNNGGWDLGNSIEVPRSSFMIRSGFVIPGSLISGINSELPGQIMAQVSQDVYDTATGRYLLIPQGSRLIGDYSSNVSFGQSRVMVAWNRIIFPDGKALDIGSMAGADGAGYSGYNDIVNTHFWKMMGAATLMSAIIAGVSLTADFIDDGDGEESSAEKAKSAMVLAMGQNYSDVMSQIIKKNLSIAPTLEIRPGFRFNVIVNKDITFHKPYESFDY